MNLNPAGTAGWSHGDSPIHSMIMVLLGLGSQNRPNRLGKAQGSCLAVSRAVKNLPDVGR